MRLHLLSAALEELLGPGMDLSSMGSTDITPPEFAEGVLGFGGEVDDEAVVAVLDGSVREVLDEVRGLAGRGRR